MLDVNMCRLCLSKDNLIDVFYSRKSCKGTNHLRSSILLCSGINILPEDDITKYVCRKCCDLSLGLFQFRKTALANERALKNLSEYVSSNFPVTVDEIVELNELLFKNRDLTLRRYDCDDVRNSPEPEADNYAVHPTVANIIKTHGNIKLPNDVLQLNLNPTVLVDSDWDLSDHDESQPDSRESNRSYSNLRLEDTDSTTEAVESIGSPDPLLEVIREQAVIPRPPQTKKRKLARKGGRKNKKFKRNSVTVPMLSNKFRSFCKIANNLNRVQEYTSDTNGTTSPSEMLLYEPDEQSFLQDLFTRYKDSRQTVSTGVNSDLVNSDSAPSYPKCSILVKDGNFVITASPGWFNYEIPVIFKYNDGATQLKIVANDTKVEPINTRLWDTDKVIDFEDKIKRYLISSNI